MEKSFMDNLAEIYRGNYPQGETLQSLEKQAAEGGVEFYVADQDIKLDIKITREMYDDQPGYATYSTDHTGKILAQDVFVQYGGEVFGWLDEEEGYMGVGEEVRRSITLARDKSPQMSKITLAEYLVRHTEQTVQRLNMLKLSRQDKEAVDRCEKLKDILDDKGQEISHYMDSKTKEHEYQNREEYFTDLMNAPKLYADCPAAVKEVAALLQHEGVLDIYTHYSDFTGIKESDERIGKSIAQIRSVLEQLVTPVDYQKTVMDRDAVFTPNNLRASTAIEPLAP